MLGIKIHCVAPGSIEIIQVNAGSSRVFCDQQSEVTSVVLISTGQSNFVKVVSHNLGQIIMTTRQKTYTSAVNLADATADIEAEMPSDMYASTLAAVERLNSQELIQAIEKKKAEQRYRMLRAIYSTLASLCFLFVFMRICLAIEQRRARLRHEQMLQTLRNSRDQSSTEDSLNVDDRSKIDSVKYGEAIKERKAGDSDKPWEDSR